MQGWNLRLMAATVKLQGVLQVDVRKRENMWTYMPVSELSKLY